MNVVEDIRAMLRMDIGVHIIGIVLGRCYRSSTQPMSSELNRSIVWVVPPVVVSLA